ncbi:MAG TPA: amidohydrolase [Acidimicrobiia bacterium]|nr:amidohydrolase [Acidimicrobiia bacterium]
MPALEDISGLVAEVIPTVIDLRRQLHTQPEPAHREFVTTDMVRSALETEGLEFRTRGEKTGGWVDVGATPKVGFRADLDALPIVEPTDNSPRSANQGWMHACGHDAHTAIAVGLATILHRLAPDIGVRFLFQPGEESNPGGAIELVAEGAVTGLDSLIAFHVDPSLRVGRIGARVGPITGSADSFTIEVHGPGGHTSRPHRTVDLVDAASRVVTGLTTAVRRSVDARSALVIAFGSIHGGDAPNVIPTEVVMTGTVRTLDPALWDVLPGLIDKALGSILALPGAGYTMDYQQGIPPVVNDEFVIETTTVAIESTIGAGTVVPTAQSMGGEDFSNYLTVTRGALLRLGTASGGGDLHSAGFRLNEESIPIGLQAGAAALLALVDASRGDG